MLVYILKFLVLSGGGGVCVCGGGGGVGGDGVSFTQHSKNQAFLPD